MKVKFVSASSGKLFLDIYKTNAVCQARNGLETTVASEQRFVDFMLENGVLNVYNPVWEPKIVLWSSW